MCSLLSGILNEFGTLLYDLCVICQKLAALLLTDGVIRKRHLQEIISTKIFHSGAEPLFYFLSAIFGRGGLTIWLSYNGSEK